MLNVFLSLQIAIADFKLKNEGSYLGLLWYLLNPMLTFAVLFLIFGDRLGSAIPNYSLYLLLGIIMFNFFQGTTVEATKTIIHENQWLIKSINFPRESLVAALVLKNLFSHFFEILLFCIIAAFKINIVSIIFYLPVLLLFVMFVMGFSLILASLTVYFADLDNIWNFAARMIWLGTPLFYAIEGQTKLFYINLFNPLYYFLTAARDLVIYQKLPELWIIFGALGFSVLAMAAGWVIFGLLKNKFAELI